GLVKLSHGDVRAIARVKKAHARHASVVTAATTLAEVLRGSPRDARVHQVLRKIAVISVHADQARAAGELLVRTGLSGHRCALDAILAAIALSQPRPVVLLTSDIDDMVRLIEEPRRRSSERIAVVRI